ncbi:helix-turn-helix domain-containing protein [Listeria ilorinensis]|uniref:helix-turn-helix domain-containing protein n=1 Tax=Listeria ilorinensis TaxID=2867439 RepID=UPI001EF72682|nr:helix-turn-helix domain-containing protein [Listeria ilorinensis]
MDNELHVQGIYNQGYGIIAKSAMRDKDLSIEAKAIYSYLCSFAGAGSTAFPGVELICAELQIGRERFYKHRKTLIDKGYIKIIQRRGEEGRQKNNIYELPNQLSSSERQSDNPTPENPQSDIQQSDNHDGNNNNLNNNNLNNNNINNNAAANNSNKNLYSGLAEADKQAAGTIPIDLNQDPLANCMSNVCQLSPFQVQDLEHWEKDLNRLIVNYAVYRAGMRGARSYALIADILKEWANARIANLADAVAYENSKKNAATKKRGAGYGNGKRRNSSTSEREDYSW